MALSLEQSRRLRHTNKVIGVGVLAAIVYVVFSEGFTSIFHYINAVILGILIALIFSFIEFILFSGKLKKWRFYQKLALKLLLYSSSITGFTLMILILYRSFRYEQSFNEVLQDQAFHQYLAENFLFLIGYIFLISFLISFTIQMSRKMGQGTLWEFITGAYYHPKMEERIIMFVAVQNADQVIREYGRITYHKFLNEVYFDVTNNILYRRGEIYEYADNELIVVWKMKRGMENANCVRTFFEMRKELNARQAIYEKEYGFRPRLFAALHYGEVIKGEVGHLKSEITYHGDPMNTTSRILGRCKSEKELLLSATLLEKLSLPIIYDQKKLGQVQLKGKLSQLELCSIYEKNLNLYY